MKNKVSSTIIFLFLLLFSSLFINVFAGDVVGYIQSDKLCEGDVEIHSSCETGSGKSYKTNGTKVVSAEDIAAEVKKQLCKDMLECGNNGFTDKAIIPEITLTGKFFEGSTSKTVSIEDTTDSRISTYSLTDLTRCADDWLKLSQSTAVFTMKLTIGSTTYKISTSSYMMYKTVDGEQVATKKSEFDEEMYKNQYVMYQNTLKFLEIIENAAREGIIAGSIGAGFNVAVPYSDKQKPLSDIMELTSLTTDNKKTITYYDFKNLSDVKYTFSYYYSPLFGKIEASELPRSAEDWVKYSKGKDFTQQNSIIVNTDFNKFFATLDTSDAEDGTGGQINAQGLKIADSITVENGAKKLNIAGSENPRSVLSYHVSLYAPYLFQISNGKGRMVTQALKPMNYTLSLYDNNIYDESMELVMGMAETNISREYLYLFNQKLKVKETASDGTEKEKTVKVGVVIVGLFDECIIDTGRKPDENFEGTVVEETKDMYLTGRKIGFVSGYSDVLDFNNANRDLLFATSEGGNKIGYLPKNISFPVHNLELKGFALYDTWSGDAALANPDLDKEITDVVTPMSDEKIQDYIFDVNNHGALPTSCEVVRFYTGFKPFTNGLEIKNTQPVEGENKYSQSGVKYAFYIVRNNKYIKDETLLNWLRTNEAQSLSYVQTETLIAKITGDFTHNLGELSFEDWQNMKLIRRELENKKNRWLVDVFNVCSMVLGTFLIIFAILFILCYWIDSFNTLSNFSILYFISFKNLFPVTDDSVAEYLGDSKGNVKYVKFKDVLIIASIMMVFGVLFLNVTYLVYIISCLYNYIMSVLGGV